MAKRSLTIAGHRTSVSVEAPFWDAVGEIAAARRQSIAALVTAIDRARQGRGNLSSAIRIYVLEWYRTGGASKAPPARRMPPAEG